MVNARGRGGPVGGQHPGRMMSFPFLAKKDRVLF